MKQTGMVRRIDELGRIVIPKEIRKQLMMKEGESISFALEEERIILTTYSLLNGLGHVVDRLLEGLFQKYNNTFFVCDEERILMCSSQSLSRYQRKAISSEIKLAFKEREMIKEEEMELLGEKKIITILPLKKENEIVGGLVMLSEQTPYYMVDEDLLDFTKRIIEQEIESCV